MDFISANIYLRLNLIFVFSQEHDCLTFLTSKFELLVKQQYDHVSYAHGVGWDNIINHAKNSWFHATRKLGNKIKSRFL